MRELSFGVTQSIAHRLRSYTRQDHRMFFEIFRFEWRQQLRAPLFWIILAAFAGLAFTVTSTDAVTVMGGASGNVLRNAPLVIARLLNAFAALSILLVVVFVANTAIRDFEQRTAELLFVTPMSRGAYLGGRFAAGYLILLLILVVCALGLALGGSMPWVDASRLGAADWRGYAWGFGVMVLPNMLFIAALLFLLATATRSLLASYVGVIAYFVLHGVAGYLSRDVNNHVIAAMLDPFGTRTLAIVTRYWSPDQANHLLPTLHGVLLFNRLLWLGVSVLMLVASFVLFRPNREGLQLPRRKKRAEPPMLRPQAGPAALALPHTTLHHDWRARLIQLRTQFMFDTRGVLRGAAFLVLLVLSLVVMIVALISSGLVYGTPVWPVTHHVLGAINGSFTLPLIIIVIFYAGELVWRERTHQSAEVSDAFPVPDWVSLLSKLGALLAIIVLMLLIGAVLGMGWQLAHGYTHLEPGLYLGMLALNAIPFVLMAVLALFLQVASNNKFFGYLLNIIWVVASTLGFSLLHWEHNLYNYGSTPGVPYSDMNGFGHFIVGALWFDAYWGCLAMALLVLSALLWVRGTGQSWRDRLHEARVRARPPLAALLAAALLAFLGLGGWIFYNTNVLNHYENSTAQKREQADYEKQYAKYADLPQPRITAVKADVDIYPYKRRLRIHAHYTLVNKHDVPVTKLLVNYTNDFVPTSLHFAPHATASFDKRLGVAIYTLKTPLAPGASMPFDFDIDYAPKGFTNGTGETFLVHNGTFFNNSLLPQFGYQTKYQLTDRNDRRKYGLKLDVPRMPPLGDQKARANTYISNDADWISFDTTVSTAADQIALAPGTLQKKWTANGRNYFHYVMQQPMLNFFAYLSARYTVKSVDWKGVDISVYYNPAHAWNVDRMIESAKDSLDYYDSHYTPYQFKQLRILEFPDYAAFAQSFANTIPFSEAIGFIADLRDKSHLDYVYDVTAHEIAHQWWAHRVIGANMQGSTMLSESLAQYSSLMVMKHKYGADQMRKFLKYELDSYLAGRANEKVAEEPLAKVENQPYIHYRKGSLVFYALQDYVGEDKLDAMLKQFLLDKGFQQPPYTDSQEFMDALSKALGPKWQPMLDDFFWKITLFDNRITDATAKKLPDGKYQVTMKVHAGMVYADGKGKETKAAPNIPIEIGVFAQGEGGKDGKPLYLEKRTLPDGDSTITVLVDGKPTMAGIDPYNELIDKVPNDNRKSVTMQ
ncbi:ABC-2 family transporter protein [Rhodanobacter glycinis]|uniref:ABC-2 family transporter protein n=3 Tax=Gammaproteobacteria TaxID=1236 RepID=A0A1I4D115_9GAMM|nr:ABC-2 family transporter protein [Rhodanobacter glycinis]